MQWLEARLRTAGRWSVQCADGKHAAIAQAAPARADARLTRAPEPRTPAGSRVFLSLASGPRC